MDRRIGLLGRRRARVAPMLPGAAGLVALLVAAACTALQPMPTPVGPGSAADPPHAMRSESLAPAKTESPAPSPSPAAPTTFPSADIVGRLGGSASLEIGCAWLVGAGGERWEVRWPNGYSLTFEGEDPVLVSAEGLVVAEAGSIIGLDGAPIPGAGSFCMVGTPFRATQVVFINTPMAEVRTPRPPDPTPTPTPSPEHPAADLVGWLAGDVEGPCSLLLEPKDGGGVEPWKIRWPEGYRLEFDDRTNSNNVALISPEGTEIARTGQLIGVDGAHVQPGGTVIVLAARWFCDFPVFQATELVFAIDD